MLSQKALYVDNTLDFHKFSWTQTKDAVPNIKERHPIHNSTLLSIWNIWSYAVSPFFFQKCKEPGQTKWDKTPQQNIYNGKKLIAR